MASEEKMKSSGGVTYSQAGEGYFEKRQLKRTAGFWGLWGIGVAAVISGDFSGWNFGIGEAGWGGLAIASAVIIVMYFGMLFSIGEMSAAMPSRVQTQSYTFISPMGDGLRYLLDPNNMSLLNFGVMALAGVILGSGIWSILAREFRFEWFAGWKDFGAHVLGGALMGTGGVLAMGCTIGQAVTGVSTLAVGSILAFFAIVIGAAITMKYQYWRIQKEG